MKRIASILAVIVVSTFGLGATGCAIESSTDSEVVGTSTQALTSGDERAASDDGSATDGPMPQTREHVLLAKPSEPTETMPQTREHVLLAAPASEPTDTTRKTADESPSDDGSATDGPMPQTREHILL